MIRPMLAAELPLAQLKYPCLATPKIDGIRAVVLDGVAYSRSMKPIRNQHVQQMLREVPNGCDGELVCGDFSSTQSAIMRSSGRPDFTYYVFDRMEGGTYEERMYRLQCETELPECCYKLLPGTLAAQIDFLAYEDYYLAQGWEGVMTRTPESPYKHGRSTPREQWLVKHKRTVDSEAIVFAVEEQMQNNNPAIPNVFGLGERKGGKALSTPKGTMGTLRCRDVHTGVEVGVASGFSEAQRQLIWDSRDSYVGKLLKYRYQASNTAPRFPRFIAFLEAE